VGLLGAIVAFMVLFVGGPLGVLVGLVMGGLILAFGLPGALVAASYSPTDNLRRQIRVAVTALLAQVRLDLSLGHWSAAGDPGHIL